MSSYRPPDQRSRLKLSKNLARLYRANKCRDCIVKITPMDFAKILGKFTKVKIQYETESPKTPAKKKETASGYKTRLKNNENGMVLLHKSAKKIITSPKKETKTVNTRQNSNNNNNNILKENNRQKKTSITKNNEKQECVTNLDESKQYGVTFIYPSVSNSELNNIISLPELLPLIDNKVLPSEEWKIDYLSDDKPKQDQVYDRIAAELEDLMYNDKIKSIKKEDASVKSEEFPSIMDILNDTSVSKDTNDVEAILLGNSTVKEEEPMEVDVKEENVGIPSAVDGELEKSVLIHIPEEGGGAKSKKGEDATSKGKIYKKTGKNNANNEDADKLKNKHKSATQVVFKHMENGKCNRLVTCMKNLIYSIELEGRTVQLKGAPKFISSLEDLKVLLEIVNETKLSSFYVV